MGRKPNSKGKEKRLQRKEEQMRLSAAKAIVDAANKLDDPLAPFPVFSKFKKNGVDIDLSVAKVTHLGNECFEWAFDLTKRNMQDKYNSCSWGWNDKKKREEMSEESAWYLLARSANAWVAFSHFRFDLDCGDEVLYCYEIQLEESVRRHGLGKFMMQILELIAFKNNMKKVILTALKNNPVAKSFYTSLNYKVDETSPEEFDAEQPIEILSKANKRLVGETPAPHKAAHNASSPLAMHMQCCSSPHCH